MVEVDPLFQPWKAGTFDTTFIGVNTVSSPITINRKVSSAGNPTAGSIGLMSVHTASAPAREACRGGKSGE